VTAGQSLEAQFYTRGMKPLETLEPDGIREVIDCPLCGNAGHSPVTRPIPDGECHGLEEPWRSMRFQMVKCRECGLIYQRIRPRRDDIGRFYSGEYGCYESFVQRGPIVRALAQFSARRLVATVERLRPPGNDVFLDFGCGIGAWMELFASIDAPWTMVGTEIATELIRRVEALGFPGMVCDDSNLDQFFAPSSIGVVHMHHVIEHVQNPLALLRTLRELLVPGGIIIGQTPESDCLERRLYGDYWVQWHLPRHLVIFDKASMRTHAERAGLEVVALKSSPSGAVVWGASLLKYRALRRGRPYRWMREPLHPYLMLLFAPLSLVQSVVTNTSHMDFILRKPV
jgi:SAM-dependent methyltransferase